LFPRFVRIEMDKNSASASGEGIRPAEDGFVRGRL
jgi:hypothetical protein